MKTVTFVPRFALFFVAALLLTRGLLHAQDAPSVKRGARVIQNAAHDVSPPFYSMPSGPVGGVLRVVPNKNLPGPLAQSGPLGAQTSSFEQDWMGATLMPSALVNFEGISNSTVTPPDTNGDVGPNHYVQIVNTLFAVYSKTGVLSSGFPKAIYSLWSGFDPGGPGHNCAITNDGDPIVIYDRMADRWIIAQIAISTLPYSECIAVSTSGDPTGSYNRYVFTYGTDTLNDYPKMGVWPDAYYMTYNMFGSSSLSGVVCAMDRASMLAGNPATQQCFEDNGDGGLLPAHLYGYNLPPAGEPEFVLQLLTTSSLRLWKFHVDWSTPANSTFVPTDINVGLFAPACAEGPCINQPNVHQKLDAVGDRLMYRLAYRNLGTHESLVVNHSVAKSPSKPNNGRIGIRWYEIQDPNGIPIVAQQSTYSPDAVRRWMGSAAMDKSGDIAIGFSVSDKRTHVFPGIRITGRLAGDPPNQMTEKETTVIDGSGSQIGQTRWGDYSSLSVDPTDDCTFWYTQEYMTQNGSFDWHTRIASFKFPSCY